MAQIAANGIKLEYEDFGPARAETILLIMGLGAQLTRWPLGLIELLTARGYRVIRYDNRDVGLSHRFHAAGPANVAQIMADAMAAKTPKAAYTLNDMADDAAGLLDALKIYRAHIVGASMGGMIAQMVAANHQARTLSLTSIMSSTGNRALPPAKPEAMAVLMTRPESQDLEAIVAHGMRAQKTIGSPAYPASDAELRARIEEDFHRAYYPDGFSRQMAAIIASGDRREALKKIIAPTVVLHGADDPLVPIDGGRDTAANIGGAELRVVPGMGHDLPVQLFPVVIEAIEAAAARARDRSPGEALAAR
jgi:pimeloyl-ACP methyl ester carboxylesterase